MSTKKAIAAVFLIGLVLMGGSALADSLGNPSEEGNCPPQPGQKPFSRGETGLSMMDNAIEAAQAEGADTSELESIRDEMNSLQGEMASLREQFRETVTAMPELEGKFPAPQGAPDGRPQGAPDGAPEGKGPRGMHGKGFGMNPEDCPCAGSVAQDASQDASQDATETAE